ncbi:TraB/GumN family protein [Sphingomonas quercus]|uniref:TraB/GumN family protein n=1 Tax=Sphingomonas quercus TaxID=2842451 RepID=UPI00341F7385
MADADTTIYLFGTFHALPPGYAWEDATLKQAFTRADRLIIETIVGDPQAMGALLFRLGTPATPLPPLLDRVPAGKRAEFAEIVKRSGLPVAMLDRLETWAAAFLLVQPMMADLGITGSEGVEEKLKAAFEANSRPIGELETVEEQLGYIDGLAEADQRAFLESFIEQASDMRAEFAAMLAAWARGDERAIADTFDKELKESPGLHQALLVRRNAHWANEIKARLDDTPGTILVAVGAGHLAGPDSVQEMLEQRGLVVTRVQ